MDKKHRKILKENHVALLDDLEPQQLLSHLTDVLSDADIESINAIKDNRRRQSELLLDILPRRGQKAFDSFVNALEKVKGQTHLVSNLILKSGKRFFRGLIFSFLVVGNN